MFQLGKRRRTGNHKTPPVNRKRLAPEPKRNMPRLRPPRVSINRAGSIAVLKGTLRVALAMGIVGAMVAVVVAGYRHATTSEYFAFREIEIDGAKRLPEEEILRSAGLALGMNVFKIDMELAQRKLMAHPWIADASIKRKLPGSVFLQIEEHRAAAIVNLDVLYLVDDTGEVFKRWSRGDPVPTPIITGIPRERFLSSPGDIREIIRAAIDLADRYKKSGLDKISPLAEVHSELSGGFSLTVGEDPTVVRFGRGPYRVKLARLSSLIRRLSMDGKRPAIIYFDNDIRPDRITVRLKPTTELSGEGNNSDDFLQDDAQKRVSKI